MCKICKDVLKHKEPKLYIEKIKNYETCKCQSRCQFEDSIKQYGTDEQRKILQDYIKEQLNQK